MSEQPPTLPPLPTSEALFSPKNSPNLDTIGSPPARNNNSNQNEQTVDDVADIEQIYKDKGLKDAAQRAIEVYKRKEVKKGAFISSYHKLSI